jgi:hypothetical protein
MARSLSIIGFLALAVGLLWIGARRRRPDLDLARQPLAVVVMAGLKREARLRARRPGHPRL